jgi:hypothetical protein
LGGSFGYGSGLCSKRYSETSRLFGHGSDWAARDVSCSKEDAFDARTNVDRFVSALARADQVNLRV